MVEMLQEDAHRPKVALALGSHFVDELLQRLQSEGFAIRQRQSRPVLTSEHFERLTEGTESRIGRLKKPRLSQNANH
jgi:hypothetical protein